MRDPHSCIISRSVRQSLQREVELAERQLQSRLDAAWTGLTERYPRVLEHYFWQIEVSIPRSSEVDRADVQCPASSTRTASDLARMRPPNLKAEKGDASQRGSTNSDMVTINVIDPDDGHVLRCIRVQPGQTVDIKAPVHKDTRTIDSSHQQIAETVDTAQRLKDSLQQKEEDAKAYITSSKYGNESKHNESGISSVPKKRATPVGKPTAETCETKTSKAIKKLDEKPDVGDGKTFTKKASLSSHSTLENGNAHRKESGQPVNRWICLSIVASTDQTK